MNRTDSGRRGTPLLTIVWVVAIGIFCRLPACDAGVPPEGIPEDAQPFKGLDNGGIDAWASGNRLFLVLTSQTANEKDGIKIARLANIVRKIHWQPDAAQKVQLHPEPDHWVINSGEAPQDAAKIIELELDEPARVFDESILSEPGEENIITLPAKLAITHGSLLRFEPQPHKNTVGYWANVKDTAEWHFQVQQSGAYEIDLLQGCGKGQGGSRVEVQIEGQTPEQTLTFEVHDTGHFQNFVWRTIGTVDLPQTKKGGLRLIPVHKAAGAVMDVRSVRLVPAGVRRSFESELADPAALPKNQ